ncbi:DUF167 domain-containing protein [Amycolatopsis cihanbeyliensis]
MMRFAVRVKPGAKRAAVGGRWEGALGEALIVAVQAPAVGGKANEAVRGALAKALAVRPRDVVVVQGERSKDKLIEVPDAPPGARERLRSLFC